MTYLEADEIPDDLDRGARRALAASFDSALEHHEIRVHFQPTVQLQDRRVVGVEALARWHRDGEIVPAAEFVGLASECGRIVELDRFVLEHACTEVARWGARNAAMGPLHLSVNLSRESLLADDVAAVLDDILRRSRLDPRLLGLEISERTLRELGEVVEPTLDALKAVGVRLVVDDVHADPMSLMVLRRHRFDELKIDRAVVDGIDRDEDAAVVARALIRVARALDLEPVAEGVERATQEQALRSMRCPLAQGWRYGRPAEDLEAVVAGAADRTDTAAATTAAPAPAPRDLTGAVPRAAATKFLESVLGSSPVAMAVVDQTGRHVLVNAAASELLGRTVPDLLTTTCWESVHPADLQADLDGMDRILRGDQVSYVVEERVVDPTGTERWVEVIVSSVPGVHLRREAPVYVLRQLRSTEEDRQASKDAAVLRSIIAAEPDALIITDPLGRCTHWNAAAERLFGRTEAQMVGEPLARLVGPSGQLSMARVVSDVTGGATVRWPDATWRSATGAPCAVDVTMGPITDETGATIGLVALARDVADRRAAEEALREAHQALKARANELAEANGRLGSFASALSHDLRQPLVILDGYLGLLDERAQELDEEHRSWLQGALRGKNRIAAAIDALHRHAADDDVILCPIDLPEIVADVSADLPDDGSVTLDVQPLPSVLGDRGFLMQIFANLFQNSLRYRGDQPLQVTVGAERDASGWRITVTDNGRGIAPEELASVFEPGRRGHASHGTQGSGTGLSTVQSLARRLGGDVWAEEHFGGARICLRLLGDEPIA